MVPMAVFWVSVRVVALLALMAVVAVGSPGTPSATAHRTGLLVAAGTTTSSTITTSMNSNSNSNSNRVALVSKTTAGWMLPLPLRWRQSAGQQRPSLPFFS